MTDYRLFMDECGDHNLLNIDNNFPAFCLTCCIFEKDYYHSVVRPMVTSFKETYCERTDVILHSREIRKQENAFSFLHDDPESRHQFYEGLNSLIEALDFFILSVVILKNEHVSTYNSSAQNPYNLALKFIMERFCIFANRNGGCSGYITAEARGYTDDKKLLEEFKILRDYGTIYQRDLSNITEMSIQKKNNNIAGLQIADLVAYPIARKILKPLKPNSSFDIIRPKIQCNPKHSNTILGYGLKVFPEASKEHLTI